jgi:hypothetical protein
MCIEKVNSLRKTNYSSVNNEPGFYRFWFEENVAQQLLSKLLVVGTYRIEKRTINDTCYWALYFGISKNLKDRAKWHISQKHTASAIKHGTISTLRHTLSALLDKDLSRSENDLNSFMDAYCYFEWDYAKLDDAEELEKKKLSNAQSVYPLNIKDNKILAKDVKSILHKLRKEHKR